MVVSKNAYLTLDEQKENATFIWTYLLGKGWTKNAIAGFLGNLQTESTINPGIWEGLRYGNYDGGYGLTQWTPADKYINWAIKKGYTYGNIDSQLKRIVYEVDANIQWFGGYSATMSFKDFTQSMESPAYLANVFIKTYEHPHDPDQPIRGTQANFWYQYLTGENPPPDDGGGGGDGGNPPPVTTDAIYHLYLSDVLRGWKNGT